MATVGGFGFGCVAEEGEADPPDPCGLVLAKSAACGYVSILLLSWLSGSPSLAPQTHHIPALSAN